MPLHKASRKTLLKLKYYLFTVLLLTALSSNNIFYLNNNLLRLWVNFSFQLKHMNEVRFVYFKYFFRYKIYLTFITYACATLRVFILTKAKHIGFAIHICTRCNTHLSTTHSHHLLNTRLVVHAPEMNVNSACYTYCIP